jgi:serine/threonine protein kinase
MNDTESSLQPGDILGGRYRIEGPIGEGGMGKVYRALDERNLNREVAIKLISSSISQSQRKSAELRLSREQEAALRIVHPNVVQVIDSGTTEQGDIYLVQEFIHGESLENLLNRRVRLNYDEVLMIVNQVGAALDAAHSEGIVHRDLKPANVMLQNLSGGGKQVKVIDFGIAKVQESAVDGKLTGTGAVIGTPFYASPEQLQSFLPDPKMDLWSFAVMTYEMITGVVPFRADTMTAIFLRQMEGPKLPRALRPDLPAEVQKVLLKSLSYKQEERYASVRDYCETLTKAFADSQSNTLSELETTVLASALNKTDQTQPAPNARPGMSRKLLRLSPYAAAFVFIIIAFAFLYFQKTPTKEPPIREPIVSKPARPVELSYSLLVNDNRGKPYPDSGRAVYRSGDGFKIVIRQAGNMNLYILNEGTNGELTLLFPARHLNGGSSLVKEKELRLPDNLWFEFDRKVGEEQLIMVLSSNPVDVMEGLFDYLGKGNLIKDEARVVQIRDWIRSQKSQPNQRNEIYETILSASDEPLVARITLQHR